MMIERATAGDVDPIDGAERLLFGFIDILPRILYILVITPHFFEMVIAAMLFSWIRRTRRKETKENVGTDG